MITAQEAKEISNRFNKEKLNNFQYLIESIEENILLAANQGQTRITYSRFSGNINKKEIETIAQNFINFGFKVTVCMERLAKCIIIMW